MKKKVFSLFSIVIASFLSVSIFSCVNVKKLTYFNTVGKDSISNIEPTNTEEKIRKNDILQINIFTTDEVVTHLLNPNLLLAGSSSASIGSGAASSPGAGSPIPSINYLVDENGEIKLPLLGSIKVVDLNKRELANSITNQLVEKKIARDPVVIIRISNYQITVLGEVTRPGVIPITNEHITLPEALGAAGDLTIYGRRDNILLIREVDGKRTWKRFNLNNQQIFNKDFFVLQNHDLIYVEPNQAKASSSDNSPQYISLGLSILSFLVLIYSQLIR